MSLSSEPRGRSVFLSHNGRHKPWVRRVADQWRALGLRVFFDEDSIAPGENVVKALNRGICESAHVVLFLSPAALNSDWVALEIAMTQIQDPAATNRRLIPVLIEPMEVDSIDASIRCRNIVDLADERFRDDRYRYLLQSLLGVASTELPAVPPFDLDVPQVPVQDDACQTKNQDGRERTATAVGHVGLELTINGDINDFSPERKASLLRAIQGLLETSDVIRIHSIRPGSIILTLELSSEEAERLYWAVQAGALDAFGVESARKVEKDVTPPVQRRSPDRQALLEVREDRAVTHRPSLPSLDAVVVGLGRAGLGLHISVLEKIRRDEAAASPFGAVVGLVDSVEAGTRRALHRLEYDYGYDPRRVRCATSLADLTGVDPDNTVVHICTPADDHPSALQAATELGFRRVIIEKPCAANTADVDEMRRIADRTGASVAVMNPYLYSSSVARCKDKIQELGQLPHYLDFEMSKPRITPPLAGRLKPESVMDVELPHQIATALYLTQASRCRVLRAEVRHMHYREMDTDPCHVVPNMGVGIIVLELDECIAVLVSSLDALTRTRVLKLRFSNTEHVEVFLPVTGDDHNSVIIEYSGRDTDGSTEQQRIAKSPDDMLSRCLFDMYARFVTDSPQLSDLTFNRKVVDVMDRAKMFGRIRR